MIDDPLCRRCGERTCVPMSDVCIDCFTPVYGPDDPAEPEETEQDARTGGCPLPEWNILDAIASADSAQVGTWDRHNGMHWQGQRSSRERSIEAIQQAAARRAGRQSGGARDGNHDLE